MSNGERIAKAPPNDLALCAWFCAYALGTVALFVAIPVIGGLSGAIPPMPWDYWWVFLFVTPLMPAALLARQARLGKFSWPGVAAFMLAALALGVFYRWFSYDLSGVV